MPVTTTLLFVSEFDYSRTLIQKESSHFLINKAAVQGMQGWGMKKGAGQARDAASNPKGRSRQQTRHMEPLCSGKGWKLNGYRAKAEPQKPAEQLEHGLLVSLIAGPSHWDPSSEVRLRSPSSFLTQSMETQQPKAAMETPPGPPSHCRGGTGGVKTAAPSLSQS